ncbi:MAG: GAF domain-containing protein [Blastocatellia bacterium]|nr:GAF domain-containing protein [Blastocatellia bacterium]MCX7752904.1 GAF domain-containing protein [Blastocatellia bacterium]MDW8167960.1 GAF domain-containing protein [Acidobacteriota bacterium]
MTAQVFEHTGHWSPEERSAYRILVIEDDPDHRLLETRALREHLGQEAVIVAVATAAEGLSALEHETFDAVLADYRMPGMDGLEFLRRVRDRELDVPVILITGLGNERVAAEALKQGAADYVIKEAGYWELLPSLVQRAIRARQTKRQIEEAQRRTTILHALTQAMSRTLEMQELLQILTRTCVEAFRAERATVYVLDRNAETILDVVTHDTRSGRAHVLQSLKGRRTDEFPIRWKLEEASGPLIISDATQSDLLPEDLVKALGVRSILGVPLRTRGKPIAALFVSAPQPNFFTAEDATFAQLIAEHAAIVLENARLYQEVRHRVFELNGLYEIARLLGLTRSPHEVYGELTALIAHLIGATRCVIATYDPTTRTLRAELPGYRVEDALAKVASYVVSEELRTFWDLRSQGPFIANRREEIPRPLQPLALEFGVENLLVAAMLAEGRTIGIIYALDKPGGFTPEDARVLSIFANQAAHVIQSARLYEELARSEQKYRSLFENAIVGIYRSTPEGRMLMANPTMARLLEYPNVEALLAIPAHEIWANPQDREPWCQQVEQHGVFESEYQVRTRTGRIRWVHDVTRVVRDADGRVLYYEGALLDITELKRAEAEREAMLEITQGATAIADLDELFPVIHRALNRVLLAENFFIALYDAQTGYFHFPYFADQYDAPPPPMRLEKTATAYVFRTGRPQRLTRERCRQLIERGELELVGTPSACWLGVPLRTPRETIGVLVVQHYEDEHAYTDRDLGFLASVANHIAVIIERKRAEEAERRTREHLARIYDLVTRFQRQELFDHVARTLAQLFEVEYASLGVVEGGTRVRALAFYSDGELQHDLSYPLHGTPCENIISRAEWCAYSRGAWEAFPEDEILTTLRIESYIGAPILSSTGEVLGVVNAFGKRPRSFTEVDAYPLQIIGQRVGVELERLREEEARLKLQEQLYQAQKMESIGTLAGGIAHDFNNILTGMMGFAELALMELGSNHPVAEDLRHILSLGARARDLVRQLLLFGRPSTGERERCNLRGFLVEVTALLGRTLPEHIEIELDLPQEALFVEANPSQLQQVLLNIAINARDAMPAGGRLRIEARLADVEVPPVPHVRPGRFARVTISDTGSGIPPHILPHIFEPFFTTKEVGKGTGLGLAVAYGIIKAHGGWIDVESEPGQGTRFHLYLPASASLPVFDKPSFEEEEPPGGHETILVIEDEAVILELARQMLQSLGYHVLTARDGQEGVALYSTWHSQIDLILLDVVMPRMSGHEAFHQLRRINPKAKILLITGYSPEHVAAELLAQGALGVVQKPYERRELARIVRQALDA